LSQRLPTVTAAQLRRVLRDLGWVEERQRGSHIRLVNGARALTVADHGGSQTLPRGTLAAILKQADLSAEEFRRKL
jgi:predicted RNA binding protein YcfA (HicA-like mRNA interferase family)